MYRICAPSPLLSGPTNEFGAEIETALLTAQAALARGAHPLGNVQEEMSALPGTSDVRLDPDGKGNVIVSGQVHDAVQEESVMQRARGLAGAYLGSDGKVVDRLSTELTSQVDIKVYVLEIDKTGLSQLGLRLQSGTPDPNQPKRPKVTPSVTAGPNSTVNPPSRQPRSAILKPCTPAG